LPTRTAAVVLAVPVLFALALSIGACDCSGAADPAPPSRPQQGSVPPHAEGSANPLIEAVKTARDRGLAALMSRRELQVGELWVLRWVAQASGHPALETRVQHWTAVARKSSPKKMALLDPAAERSELPAEPGEGLVRFTTFLQAANAEPEARALQFVKEFLDEPGAGYVATHQFFVLVWWEESRGKLPPELFGRRAGLAARVMEEQLAATEFSDLFAERGFLLGAFGGACVEDLAKWAQVAIDAQEPDGLWGDRSWTLEYAGTVYDVSGIEHTAALAVALLQGYLSAAQDPERHCGEGA
jgi:hypothetical protein